jgi:hypothetical protein
METGESALDRALDVVVLAGLAMWIVLVLLLHQIKAREHDISTDAMSLFAVGDFGFLMTAAFVGLGLAHLALATRLYRHLGRWFGPSLLTLIGVCLLASAVFETDPKNTEPLSTHGSIHVLVGLFVFVVMALTPLVFAGSLRRIRGWGRTTRASLIFGVATVAAFLAMPLGFRDAYFGIGQRILVALYLAWLIIVALASTGAMREQGSGSATLLRREVPRY